MKSNQSGRSMIEMLGVLAIIGVLSVGGIAGYSKAMAKYRANKVMEQISMFVTNTRTMYAQQQTYMNLANTMAVDMGIVPDDLIIIDNNGKPTGALRNVFGGPVQIAPSYVNDPSDKSAFILSFFNMSRDACIAIATSDWGAGSSSGLLAMHVYSVDALSTVDVGGTMDAPVESVATDTTLNAITTASTGSTENGIAVPGDATVGVPMRIDQARSACSCANKSTCAVSWKYY